MDNYPIYFFALITNIANAVYPAPTATTARTLCHTSPLSAHGHCPAKYDILDMARQWRDYISRRSIIWWTTKKLSNMPA